MNKISKSKSLIDTKRSELLDGRSFLVELGVLVSLRLLGIWVPQLGKALRRRGANKVGLHVVDAALRIYQVLLVLALYLDLATHYAMHHVHQLFFVVLYHTAIVLLTLFFKLLLVFKIALILLLVQASFCNFIDGSLLRKILIYLLVSFQRLRKLTALPTFLVCC